MAAATLRRYVVTPANVNTNNTLVSAVGASRALVVSKIIVANFNVTTATFVITAATQAIVSGMPLGPGEVYSETGLVLLAGDTVVVQSSVASTLAFSLYGEEVDN